VSCLNFCSSVSFQAKHLKFLSFSIPVYLQKKHCNFFKYKLNIKLVRCTAKTCIKLSGPSWTSQLSINFFITYIYIYSFPIGQLLTSSFAIGQLLKDLVQSENYFWIFCKHKLTQNVNRDLSEQRNHKQAKS